MLTSAVGVVGLDQIAGLHEKTAGASVDGRRDGAIRKVEFRGFERGLIHVERGFGAVDGGLVGAQRFVLRIECGLVSGVLIFRDQAFLRQRLVSVGLLFGVGGLHAVARQIRLRLSDQRLIFSMRRLRLIDGLLIGARIDFKKLLAFADVVAFLEKDFGEFAADLRFDGDHCNGFHRSDLAHLNRHVFQFRLRRRHGVGRQRTAPAGPFGGVRCAGVAGNQRREHKYGKGCSHVKYQWRELTSNRLPGCRIYR